MVVLLMLTGCTSMRTIEPTPTAAQQHFKVGDTITVHTVDDTIYEFEIVEITENSIVGKRSLSQSRSAHALPCAKLNPRQRK
ncbi:MAG: hypothetical protein B6247_15165 [Candidatus Parabeggiatoa sp. nov. 2]|nr:MAG: hypothetical protein B6247_15165 [Beggiatoa sp. 4572_84]